MRRRSPAPQCPIRRLRAGSIGGGPPRPRHDAGHRRRRYVLGRQVHRTCQISGTRQHDHVQHGSNGDIGRTAAGIRAHLQARPRRLRVGHVLGLAARRDVQAGCVAAGPGRRKSARSLAALGVPASTNTSLSGEATSEYKSYRFNGSASRVTDAVENQHLRVPELQPELCSSSATATSSRASRRAGNVNAPRRQEPHRQVVVGHACVVLDVELLEYRAGARRLVGHRVRLLSLQRSRIGEA